MAEKNVIFGCVTDRDQKFLEQAVRLVASLRWFGGSLAEAKFMVCHVDGMPEAYAASLQKLGAELVAAERFDPRHGASNKLRFLELPELEQYDAVALLDCDTLVVQDPASYVPTSGFAARLAGMATLKPEAYLRVVKHFQLPEPAMDCQADVSGAPMYPYYNSGVCLFARNTFQAMRDAWIGWNRTLMGKENELGFLPRFTDQVSLAMALLETNMPVTKLPSAMNFAAHYPLERYAPRFSAIDPVILHYHEKGLPGGGIDTLALPKAWQRAQAFNAKLAEAKLLPGAP